MKTILITGFNPFGGEKTNPSFDAVKLLPDKIDGAIIIKQVIPTEFYKSKDVMLKYLEEYKPDIVINVGQAGGRKSISLEKYAYNMMDARIPDNAGFAPQNQKISEYGNDILESSLPLIKLENALKQNNIDCYISDNPGRFVCNYIMYEMLLQNKAYNFISGFIHVPFSKEQVKEKPDVPSMDISDMTLALEVILKELIKK